MIEVGGPVRMGQGEIRKIRRRVSWEYDAWPGLPNHDFSEGGEVRWSGVNPV